MATFLLIHGGSHGGWCWERIVPLLKAEGHIVHVPDLPGSGDDRGAIRDVTFLDRVRFVTTLVLAQAEPVILVGHSMGGPLISQVAEAVPERVAKLVYLAAFMLRNGECLWDSAKRVSHDVPGLTVSDDGRVQWVSAATIADFFYNTTDDFWLKRASGRVGPESVGVGSTPVRVTQENFGSIDRFYIETLRDLACVPDLQRLMQEDWPCRAVFQIDSDHSPFYSRHNELSDILKRIALIDNI